MSVDCGISLGLVEVSDFIATYDDWMPSDLCSRIIQQFDAGPQFQGQTGQGVDLQKKNSLDLTISGKPEWQQLLAEISEATLRGAMAYMRQYPFLLVGALSPSVMSKVTGQPESLSHQDIATMQEPQLAELMIKMYRIGRVNVQKYLMGQGGYHHWHSEVYPRDQTCETLHRVLFFMFYLNTVEEGGETTFFYQPRTVQPQRGRMMVAPAGFTHTHKGNVPRSGDKYVVTSWIMFRRAESMFGPS